MRYTTPKKPIVTLDFLSPDVNDTTRAELTVSSSLKVLCRCIRCCQDKPVTFFSAYRQRLANGEYVCRACRARENGAKTTPESIAKRRETNQSRYGVEHPMQLDENRMKIRDRWNVFYSDHPHPMHTPDSIASLQATNVARYGVPYTTSLPQVHHRLSHTQTSQGEREVREFLEQLTSDSWAPNTTIIAPKHIDCYNMSRHIGVEFHGIFWHSSRYKTPDAHVTKWQMCRDAGIRLYTIFDDEWESRRIQIQSFLSAQLGFYERRIHGRQCEVREISSRDVCEYVNLWHIQPLRRASKGLGLFYQDVCVGLISFGPHHRMSNVWSLSRLCFAPSTHVSGGVSKLLSALKTYLTVRGVRSIVTWSDHRWSDGTTYAHTGWILDGTIRPDYSYVVGRVRVPKQDATKRKLGCPDTMTEQAFCTQQGWYRIWDCGKTRWRLSW